MKTTKIIAALFACSLGSAAIASPVGAAGGGCSTNPITAYTPTPGVDTAFGVTAGPGGTWYAHGGTINRISNGKIDEFPIPDAASASAGWMAWDGDSSYVWYTDRTNGRVGNIDGQGRVHQFQVPDGKNGTAGPNGLVLGPGSQVWFTDPPNDRIGMLDTSTGTFAMYATPTTDGWPLGITRGSDGALYFTERSADKVGRMNADGSFTEWDLTTGAFPNRIVVGPDGSLWFTELRTSMIGRLTVAGDLTETPIDGGPVGITATSDGAVYVALFFAGAVARLDADAEISDEWVVPGGALLVGESRGSIWSTNAFGDAVNRIRTNC